MDLHLLQINIKSLKNNKINVENFLSSCHCDILVFCETWLTVDDIINFKNFDAHHNARIDGYGGVSVYTNKKFVCKSKVLSDVSPIEAIEVDILNTQRKVKVVSFYIPPNMDNNIAKTKFSKLVNKYTGQSNVILAGDINAHHTLWNGGIRSNTRGDNFCEIINMSNFSVLNDGSYTFQQFYKGRLYQSTLDVTLCTPDLCLIAEWEAIEEFVGSDHIPVKTILCESSIRCPSVGKRVDKKKAIQLISETNFTNTCDIDEFLSKINNQLEKATVSDRFEEKKWTPKPWWSEKIQNLWNLEKTKAKDSQQI